MQPLDFYTFTDILPLKQAHLEKGCFLVLVQPSKTPVHLAYLAEGIVYELTIKGPRMTAVSKYVRKATQGNIPLLFIGLKTQRLLHTGLSEIFMSYRQVSTRNTCMEPIKVAISKHTGIDCLQAEVLFDLLHHLKHHGLSNTIMQHKLNESMQDNTFRMPVYNMEDVKMHIAGLKENAV